MPLRRGERFRSKGFHRECACFKSKGESSRLLGLSKFCQTGLSRLAQRGGRIKGTRWTEKYTSRQYPKTTVRGRMRFPQFKKIGGSTGRGRVRSDGANAFWIRSAEYKIAGINRRTPIRNSRNDSLGLQGNPGYVTYNLQNLKRVPGNRGEGATRRAGLAT